MQGFIVDTKQKTDSFENDLVAYATGHCEDPSVYLNAYSKIEGLSGIVENGDPEGLIRHSHSTISTPHWFLTAENHYYHIDDEDIALYVYNEHSNIQSTQMINYMRQRFDLTEDMLKDTDPNILKEAEAKYNETISKLENKIKNQEQNKIIHKVPALQSVAIHFKDEVIFTQELIDTLKERIKEFCFIKNIDIIGFRTTDFIPLFKEV